MIFFRKLLAILTFLIFALSITFSDTYTGLSYSGTKYQPETYSGSLIEPFEYNGVELYPISYTGSIINEVYYEGIDLRNYKITTLTITGKETDSDIFDESVPSEYRIDWEKVLTKYTIGTTVIVITGVVSLCAGALPLASAGYIATGAFTGAAGGAVIGAATDALITGSLAFLKGEPKAQIYKAAIEASADGFMWGAITGAIASGSKSANELKKGVPVLNSKGKIQHIVDKKGIVYKAKGGIPLGHVLNRKNKSGNFVFFYDKNGKLYNFDNKLIAEHFSIRNNGILYDLKSQEKIAYIDTKGIINTDAEMKIAIKEDIRIENTINMAYKDLLHPDTGIPYKEKIITDGDGIKHKGVFPQFNTEFEAKLPSNLYYARDTVQFKESTKQLRDFLEKNPKLKDRFTVEQLKQIEELKTPTGFTWHHNEDLGRMQLIDFNTHYITRHTGGRSIWGGGSAFRK